jgi:hypothetical protein
VGAWRQYRSAGPRDGCAGASNHSWETDCARTKARFFPYRFDRRRAPLFLALGVRDADGVTLCAKGALIATFGRFKVETTLDNVDRTEVTAPHRWTTAVGLRLALTDDVATFGTSHRKGLSTVFVLGPQVTRANADRCPTSRPEG